MTVTLLIEHHLEFLSLKGGCIGSSESTPVKMPHCWKSHVMAHIQSTDTETQASNWSSDELLLDLELSPSSTCSTVCLDKQINTEIEVTINSISNILNST